MNIVKAFALGQKGDNMGLPMGEGLEKISLAINHVQKARIYTVAAAPKGGKSTFADVGFVIGPLMFVIDNNTPLYKRMSEIARILETETDADTRRRLNEEFDACGNKIIPVRFIYYSYEIDRVTKEFDFMAHFLNRDYGITTIPLPVGKTYKGKTYVDLSPDYLKGELVYDNVNPNIREIIKVPPELEQKMIAVYNNRIIPIFGEYDFNGKKIREGFIDFQENKENPTGIRNYLLEYARQNGTFVEDVKFTNDNKQVRRLVGYQPKNPKLITIIITDHLRKLVPERGFKLKETVDKFSEYAVELRNLCQFTFVHIIHLNRAIADASRRKLDGDRLYPMSDDIKETGNLSEDSNYIFTMFNPNDDKFGLNKHFGTQIRDTRGKLLYPKMRTIHLVESRHCEAPQHFRVNMFGNIKKFESLTL